MSHLGAARRQTSNTSIPPVPRRRPVLRKEERCKPKTGARRLVSREPTGRVGSHLVEILAQRGHDVVPIARSKGVDVVSGEGLDQALVGVETIIDTATGPSPDQEEATAFFTASGQPAASRGCSRSEADRPRFDRRYQQFPQRLQRGEGGAGAHAARRSAPVRIVRAAQFHEFVDPLVGWTIQDGVAHVPEMRTQLVAARVVADTLADAAEEPEIENGRITEVAVQAAGGATRRSGSGAVRQPR